MTLIYIANNVDDKAYEQVRDMFLEIDVNKNGYINSNDFKQYFKEHMESKANQEMLEIKGIFDSIDLNQNG